MCPWGYYLAQAAQLPGIASYSLIPMTPHMMRDFRVLRMSIGVAFKGIASSVKANRISTEIAKRYSIQKPNMMESLNVSGDLCVVYSSAEFVPYAATFPPKYKFVGWTIQEPIVQEPFVHEGAHPLIYASLGTLINDNFAFFKACIDAFSHSSYDLLISTGGRYKPEEFGETAANVTVREWVPQVQVLQQASLFITHGGVNSIHDGLYNNLPLLLVPQQAEQTINSLAVTDQHAGLMLKRDEVNAESVSAAAAKILGDPAYRRNAERLGLSLRAGGGAARAADEIEKLVPTYHNSASK
jgi:MGT family glycosyltransferase